MNTDPISTLTVVPATSVTAVPPPAMPETQLPFDPRRLLGGIVSRWRWVALAVVAGTALGIGAGFYRSATRYEVTVRLLKRDVPVGFRAGEFGDAFKPRAINNATLIGTALSDNVLGRVATRAEPAVSLPLLRLSVEAKEQKGTDFVTLTVSGYTSREDTVALANLWGQEIVQFSRELQTRESREVRVYAQAQIERTESEIKRINREMMELAQHEGVVDVDRQVEAYLRAMGELDLRIEASRSSLFATETRLRSLETELARMIPVRERVDLLQRELLNAQTAFGDGSPVVQELREQMTKLQGDYQRQQKKEFNPMSVSTTTLGSTLFLQIMEVRAQRAGYVRQLPELERLRAENQKQLAAMPQKSSKFTQLQQQRLALEAPRRMLVARLREAQHFEENAPGYFQLFSTANPEGVGVRPRWLKLLIFAAAGSILGGGLGLAAGVGGELIDSRLRTAAEAKRLYQSPVWTVLSRRDTRADWRGAVERLWLQWISTRDGRAAPLAIWSAQPAPAEEVFWSTVIEEAERLLDGMLIVDVGEEWSPRLAALPIANGEPIRGVQSLRVDPRAVSLSDVHRLIARLTDLGGTTLVCVRFAGAVREPATSLARACSPALVFVSADVARLDFWATHARLLRTAVKPPAGLIVAGESELFHAK